MSSNCFTSRLQSSSLPIIPWGLPHVKRQIRKWPEVYPKSSVLQTGINFHLVFNSSALNKYWQISDANRCLKLRRDVQGYSTLKDFFSFTTYSRLLENNHFWLWVDYKYLRQRIKVNVSHVKTQQTWRFCQMRVASTIGSSPRTKVLARGSLQDQLNNSWVL